MYINILIIFDGTTVIYIETEEQRMPRRSERVKAIQEDLNKARKNIKKATKDIEELTDRLKELEVYSSSSEELQDLIKIGDQVEATTEPHKGRTGTVTSAGSYWVTVKADWIQIIKGKQVSTYRKARHNLKKIE